MGAARRAGCGELVPARARAGAWSAIRCRVRGSHLAAPIRLTFSKPLAAVLGSARPKLSPPTRGRWHQADSHTLVFVPSGFGAGFATNLRVQLPRAVALIGRAGRRPAHDPPARVDGAARLAVAT